MSTSSLSFLQIGNTFRPSRKDSIDRRIVTAAVSVMLMGLSGCAHVAELVDNPSIEHERFPEFGHMLLTVAGDRRLVRTTHNKDGTLIVCAETQADAISARSASSALEAVGKGAISDEIAERLTLTNARTELSDVVRQLAWHLCNARANGQIEQPSYESALKALQAQAMLVLAHRASTDNSAAVKEIIVLQEKTDAGAAKLIEATKARDAEKTVQSKERTAQMELLSKQQKYEDCRQDNRDNPTERAKCSAPQQ